MNSSLSYEGLQDLGRRLLGQLRVDLVALLFVAEGGVHRGVSFRLGPRLTGLGEGGRTAVAEPGYAPDAPHCESDEAADRVEEPGQEDERDRWKQERQR